MSRPGSAGAAVAARSLAFTHPSGRRGVEGVELTVQPGERVVVLGPNGSGKSTLLQLLAGLLMPDSGSVSVLGADPARAERALRRRVGVALDRPAHWDALTGRQNAALLARAAGLAPERAEAAARSALARFGLEEELPVGHYSLGMHRRLLLAETLVHDPGLLLLDEPTLGLDPSAVQSLAAALVERSQAGAAAISATNDVRAAPLLGERVAFLLEGRKVVDEPTVSLLARLQTPTRLEVRLGDSGASPAELVAGDGAPGELTLRQGRGLLVASSPRGAEALPDLLRWVLSRGGSIANVRVREPDLADAFRELTGAPLDADGEPL